jgi:hypothetical protein
MKTPPRVIGLGGRARRATPGRSSGRLPSRAPSAAQRALRLMPASDSLDLPASKCRRRRFWPFRMCSRCCLAVFFANPEPKNKFGISVAATKAADKLMTYIDETSYGGAAARAWRRSSSSHSKLSDGWLSVDATRADVALGAVMEREVARSQGLNLGHRSNARPVMRRHMLREHSRIAQSARILQRKGSGLNPGGACRRGREGIDIHKPGTRTASTQRPSTSRMDDASNLLVVE